MAFQAIDWLKGLLDTAKDTVQAERETGDSPVTQEDNKQALTKLFLETRPESTPKLIGDVVEQIDKMVKAKHFKGWQSSNSGPRDSKGIATDTCSVWFRKRQRAVR